MWVLKKLTGGAIKYLISDNNSITVGRKSCDLVIEGDSSVSRKHCTIYIAKKKDCPFNVNTITGVWIVDEQSKYGTFINNNNNWVKLNPNENQKLSNGSIIRFGLMENIWSLKYQPVVACTSGVQTELKKELANTLKLIDGELRNAWAKDITVVVVNEITLTVKVVLALIHGIPIVTKEYIQQLVDCIKKQTSLPDYKDYRPDIKESILDASLISFDVDSKRKELFKDKTFVIPTKKQLETLKDIILSAGGKVELFTGGKNQEHFARKNVILIQLSLNNSDSSDELTRSFNEIASFLKNKHGKRLIPESEIAQAVAYSSTEKYCNPYSTCFNLKSTNSEPNSGIVFVEETPDMSKLVIPGDCVIPCSSTTESQNSFIIEQESQKSIIGRKRNHSLDDLECELPKRKIRNKRDSNDESLPDVPPVEKEISQKSCADNQNDKTLRQQATESTNTLKRKVPTGDDSAIDSSTSKKVKYPDEPVEKQPEPVSNLTKATDKLSNKIEIRNYFSLPSSSSGKSVDYEKDHDDPSDFIEKDKPISSDVDELNNTIYSLTLISSAFLKEDGSLIDPPAVPVNVKRFTKGRKSFSNETAPFQEIDENILDGDWLEPHPVHLCASQRDVW